MATHQELPQHIWEGYTYLVPVEIKAAIERVVQGMRTWIRAFRSHSQAHLITVRKDHVRGCGRP